MQCEVCGRRIVGKPYKAIIEGARLMVCSDCATLGSLSWELKTLLPTPKPAKSTVQLQRPSGKPRVSTRQEPIEATSELVEDFGARIRQARESQELSLEDLGRKINEKVSLLKKLESQKMRPNVRLAEKLQHMLKIKLLVPAKEEKVPKDLLTTTSPSKTITLGELIGNRESSEATG